MKGECRTGAVGAVAILLALGGSAAAQQLRLPPDLVYATTEGSPGKVVFSHEVHVAVSEKCTTCHISLFRMLRPTRTVTHAEMETGKACGACHNDQMAFGPTDPAGCSRCHLSPESGASSGEGREPRAEWRELSGESREPGPRATARGAARPRPHTSERRSS